MAKIVIKKNITDEEYEELLRIKKEYRDINNKIAYIKGRLDQLLREF